MTFIRKIYKSLIIFPYSECVKSLNLKRIISRVEEIATKEDELIDKLIIVLYIICRLLTFIVVSFLRIRIVFK